MSWYASIQSANSKRGFATTAWSVVRQAGGDQPQSQQAMAQLCQGYWYPIYSFVRRSGHAATDAEDITQSFFAWMLESNVVARAESERGRFRTFLIAALKQFLARRHAHDNAAKRCERGVVSLDVDSAEQRYAREPWHSITPEKLFEHEWALAVLSRTFQILRGEWEQDGKLDRYELLKPYLVGQGGLNTAELARRLAVSEGAIRVSIHRLKRRFGEIVCDEVTQTLENGGDLDAELADLREALKLQ